VSGQTWTQITTECTDANGGGITFPNACYWRSGGETIIWTYHFTDYAVMTPTDNGGHTHTNVTLDLLGVDVTIGAPTDVTFPAVTANVTVVPTEIALSGTDYFWLDDLLGANSGYNTTVQMADLTTSGSGTIALANVAIQIPAASVTLMAGSANPRVLYSPVLNTGYQAFSSSAALTFVYRDNANNSGLVGQYGLLPKLRINVPAFQTLGSYSGVLTYTLL
jgi:hypothetical protein